MKKNVLTSLLLASATLIGFYSCNTDDDKKTDTPDAQLPGAYVLGAGMYQGNGAALNYYVFEKKKLVNVFESANGIGLGDTAQDMIIYGSKRYVAMYGSGLIYVLDSKNKIITTIRNDAARPTEKLQPRSLETYNGKVYVSLFDGYLARIDTTSLVIDKSLAVGPNPEAVKAVNGKLYVANSGAFVANHQFNNTVSVVDPELTSKTDITVAVNPVELKVDKYKNLYLVSRGNYGKGQPAISDYTLQQINTSTSEVTVIEEGKTYSMFPIDNRLYLLSKEWAATGTKSWFRYYDIDTKKIVDGSFITDGTQIADISNVDVDPASGDFYVSASNSVNNGDVYIIGSNGKLKSKFDSGSAFPVGVWFVGK